MEWIEDRETPDKRSGLIGSWVPVWTLEFDFGFSILLGKGGGIVGTKRG